MLHDAGEDDAAWRAAEANADRVDLELWEQLFRRRIGTDAASTLPHYRRIVDGVLVEADRRTYRAAARLLLSMRDAARAAGRIDEFKPSPSWLACPMKAMAMTVLDKVPRYMADRPLASAMVATRAV
ncbi:MAG: hypothetical protein ACRDVZ_11565 [Jiangellaceae bacterium]